MGVAGGESAGLSPKVEEDSISFPAAEGANGGLVHTGDKESSGATGVEAVSFDAIRRDGTSCVVQFSIDVMGCDIVGAIKGVIVVVERTIGSSVVLKEVVYTSSDGSNVLLISVGKGDIGPLIIPRAFIGRDVLGK